MRSSGDEDDGFSKNQILTFLMIWILWLFQVTTGDFFSLVRTLAIPLLLAWIVWLINSSLFRSRWNFLLGIRPRRLTGLIGIFCSPFLHAGYGHILNNSIAYGIRGSLILMTGLDNLLVASLVTALSSGLGVWLLSPTRSYTVGASGVTYGYLGFLLSRGYFQHEIIPAVFSLFSLFFYYDRALGLFPHRPRMSWQGHLFGFLGGVATAYYLSPIKAVFPFHWFHVIL